MNFRASIFVVILSFCTGISATDTNESPAPQVSILQNIGSTVSSLFSYENQKSMISAYNTAKFLVQLPLLFDVLSATGSKPLNPLPEEIETAVQKMGMDKSKIGFYQSSTGSTGYASALGNVTIDPEFYQKATREERLMVIGHELTHIRDHHAIKKLAAHLIMPYIAGTFITASTDCIDKAVIKASESEFLKKFPKVINALQSFKNASEATLKSPLCFFLLTEGAQALLSRHFEKSADLESVKALDCAQGGVSFFSPFAEKSKNRSLLSSLHPRRLFYLLEDTLGLSSHPETAERVNYLKALAHS